MAVCKGHVKESLLPKLAGGFGIIKHPNEVQLSGTSRLGRTRTQSILSADSIHDGSKSRLVGSIVCEGGGMEKSMAGVGLLVGCATENGVSPEDDFVPVFIVSKSSFI